MTQASMQTLAPARERIFIGLPIPQPIGVRIQPHLAQFGHVIRQPVPLSKWHLTVLWMGEVYNPKQYYSRLRKPLTLPFVATVRLLHLGRGRARNQLWIYAEPSNVLLQIRQHVVDRLKSMRFAFPEDYREEFVPHVTVAKLYDHAGRIGLADYPVPCSFAVKELYVWRSQLLPTGSQYTPEATISLV